MIARGPEDESMRVKLLLAGLLMLLPFPAFADVTASYSVSGKDKLVIEADAGGNSRASLGEKFAVIRRDGIDYVLVADAAGDLKIARLEDVVAMVTGQLKNMGGGAPGLSKGPFSMIFEMKPGGGQESVAGYSGTLWHVGPAEQGADGAPPLPVVLSGDAALVPVGAVFRNLLGQVQPMFDALFGAGGNFSAVLLDLLDKGTPLRIGPALTLVSVSTAEIAASRFELPGTVLEPMEFLTAITPSESGAGLPPLP
jgi:hypothetical protein